MKKLIVAILGLAMILTACSAGNNDKDTALNTKALNDFTEYIASDKGPLKTKSQLDSIMKDANAKTADALVYKYLDYMSAFIGNAPEKYQSQLSKLSVYYDQGKNSIAQEKIKEADIKEFYTSLTGAGFKFSAEEGMLYPVIDYHFIEGYSNYISEEMKGFAVFMAMDSDNKWAGDGEIRITLTELADRIAAAETYLAKYPGASGKSQVVSKYKMYLGAFLGGIDNTPLVNYDTGKINDKFVEAYGYFIKKYPDLKTAVTVKKFDEELKNGSYKAPYSYSEYEKRTVFNKHVDDLVKETGDKL